MLPPLLKLFLQVCFLGFSLTVTLAALTLLPARQSSAVFFYLALPNVAVWTRWASS